MASLYSSLKDELLSSTIAEGGDSAEAAIGYDQRLLGPLVSPSFDPAMLAGYDFLLGGADAAERSRDAAPAAAGAAPRRRA